MKDRIWYKFFFKSLAYLLIGLFTLLMGHDGNVPVMIIGGLILVVGAIMLAMSLVSFVKWLVK